ncbi:MAG: polymerase sigma-70 factor, subfamily [Streptosporangiaceae bacterium]|nr:polymerase sigma-70 factor, subfamily [Streptosporangiaceae bacterium]
MEPRGDSEQLRALHDEYAQSLLSYVAGLTRDRASAQDVVIDQWRSARRRPEVLADHVPEQTVEDTMQQTVDRQLVHAALQTLSIEHRQALFECYFRGASIAEAADTLGVPPGTVKSRTHYALRALRQAVDGMGGVA